MIRRDEHLCESRLGTGTSGDQGFSEFIVPQPCQSSHLGSQAMNDPLAHNLKLSPWNRHWKNHVLIVETIYLVVKSKLKPIICLMCSCQSLWNSMDLFRGKLKPDTPSYYANAEDVPIISHWYPRINCHITMENHHFSWENPLQITIFHSPVKLPEGKSSTRHRQRPMRWRPSKSFIRRVD